jgi:LmbE family N-acetylglucosaminyl deacetylase
MPGLPSLDLSGFGRTVVVAPHDDDAAIGCGGLIQALPSPPVVVVVTDGRLGYHSLDQRDTIVALRRDEATACYARLGLPAERVRFLGLPDMSLGNFLCFETLDARPGVYQLLLRAFREWQVETVLLPSCADVHPDHRATHEAGQGAALLARDTLMPDLGAPAPIRQVLAYQVWEPLEHPDARLVLDPGSGQRKREALSAYVSQGSIIAELLRRETLSFGEERFSVLTRF